MSRKLVRWGPGAVLLVAGAVLAIWAAAVPTSAPPRLVESDRPVNPGATNPGDIRAQNSPTIVQNPRNPENLVVTSRIDSPDFSCAVHMSTDGGHEWRETGVPIPAGGGRTCYAPDAAFEPDGTLHVSFVTLAGVANTPRAVWVASSRDGGRTLSAPTKISGPLAFQARIAADPAAPGRLFVTWVQARDVGNFKFTAPGNPILMATSGDGGATWGTPARVNDPRRGRVLAPSAALGPDRQVYVLYLDVGGDRLDYEGAHEGSGGPRYPGRFALVLARSLDEGRSWEESVVDDGVVPIARFIPFLPPSPSLAVDRGSGRVHVAFHDGRLGSPDVWVWSLAPGDRGWGEPARVNDTPRGDRGSQYMPALAVAPGGRLDVVYYDRRDDRRDVFNGVSLQSSDDGGRTFGPRVRLSRRTFDSRIGFGSERALPDLGSRVGVTSGERQTTAVWTDTRAGTEASNKQDLVRAVAAPGRAGVDAGTAETVGRAGFAVAAGGALALLLALRGSTRRQ